MISGSPSDKFYELLESPQYIAGVDEAGRGALAGPVVAAAVMLGPQPPPGLDDSKKLSPMRRENLAAAVRQSCAYGIGLASPSEIDERNILRATMLAMSRAVARLEETIAAPDLARPHLLALIDGNLTPQGRCETWRWPARAIIGGDSKEPAISAASILAKTWRDKIMVEAAQGYPQFGWERNKGYGSKEHMEALRLHGPSPLHRRSFGPVSQREMAL